MFGDGGGTQNIGTIKKFPRANSLCIEKPIMPLPVGCPLPLGAGAAGGLSTMGLRQFNPAYLFFSTLNFLLEVLYLVVQGGHHCLEALVKLHHGTYF